MSISGIGGGGACVPKKGDVKPDTDTDGVLKQKLWTEGYDIEVNLEKCKSNLSKPEATLFMKAFFNPSQSKEFLGVVINKVRSKASDMLGKGQSPSNLLQNMARLLLNDVSSMESSGIDDDALKKIEAYLIKTIDNPEAFSAIFPNDAEEFEGKKIGDIPITPAHIALEKIEEQTREAATSSPTTVSDFDGVLPTFGGRIADDAMAFKKELLNDHVSRMEEKVETCMAKLSQTSETSSMQELFKPSKSKIFSKAFANAVRVRAQIISGEEDVRDNMLRDMARLLLNDVSDKQSGGIDANSLVDIEEYLVEYIGNPEKFYAIFPKNDDEFYGITMGGLQKTPAAIALEKINEQDLAATTSPLTVDDGIVAAEMAAETTPAPIIVNTVPTTVAEMRAKPEDTETFLASVRSMLSKTHSKVEPESPGFVDRKMDLLEAVLSEKIADKHDSDAALNILLLTSNQLIEKGLSIEWAPNSVDDLYAALTKNTDVDIATLRAELASHLREADSKGEDGLILNEIMTTYDLSKNQICREIENSQFFKPNLGEKISELAAKFIAKKTKRSVEIIDGDYQSPMKFQGSNTSLPPIVIVKVGGDKKVDGHFVSTENVDSKGGGKVAEKRSIYL